MELSKNKENIYSQLQRKKMRDKSGLFAVEGWKSVCDTIDNFSPEALVVINGFDRDEDWLRTVATKVPVYEVSPERIAKISALSTPPEIIAIYSIPEDVYSDVPVPEKNKLYLLLDEIQDPGNLGTIIRTAHWFGVERIYCSRTTVDLFNPKTVQSTMGSLGKVEVIYCDLSKLIGDNPDMPVYGTLLNGNNIYNTSLTENGFILMGNEGRGISEELRTLVTSPLLIPSYNPADHSESLNVAIATAVTLSQFRSRLY